MSSLTSTSLLRSRQSSSPSTLSLLLSRVVSTTQRRGGASMLVRETAGRELEERRADWGYSRTVLALDIIWNLAFVVVSAIMLMCTTDENPDVPIRVWVCGYALRCLVHVVLVWVEYKKRNPRQDGINGVGAPIGGEENQSDNEEDDDERNELFGISSGSRPCGICSCQRRLDI